MISVEKIYEGVRLEGVNYGLPMTFVKLGEGNDYSSGDDLLKDIVMFTKCNWVCLLGKDTTQVGMGNIVKALASMDLSIEVEQDGRTRTPGWMHSVERWLVDYIEGGPFNYFALRTQDMVRFVIGHQGDLLELTTVFEDLKMCPATKCLVVLRQPKPGKNKELYQKAFELSRKYDRTRVYLV